MKEFESLATPSLLVDKLRLRENVARLRGRIPRGISLRIHAKTCKSVNILRECAERFPVPIAVSTLAETEYFSSCGLSDIIYAVGISPGKLARISKMQTKPCLILDNLETAINVGDFCSQNGSLDILFEIDCDGHRGGFLPDSPDLLKSANILSSRGAHIRGVLTHAGSAYELEKPSPDAFCRLAEQERKAAVFAAAELRATGHEIPVVSTGSTPTALFGRDFKGLSEVRAGVFMFFDGVMASLGVCSLENIAISVLTTVIGKRNRDGAIIVDAGWSAMSSDRGRDFRSFGYGIVCDVEGVPIPGLILRDLNQEHGIILPDEGYEIPNLPPGTLLRILPQHACATAQNFSIYNAHEGLNLINRWQRKGGW